MLDTILSLFLHLDQVLPALFVDYGNAVYLILFLVVFCETGLIFMPFLPGDSLLFAAGALMGAVVGGSIWAMWALLLVAAILGDTLNYRIGHLFGKRLSHHRWVNEKHIERSRVYFDKYGGKAIFLGRFLPIIRTFVPFVAGISQMPYSRFTLFNVSGAFVWVSSFLFAGYWFGQLNFVQNHFSSIVLAIMGLSVLPILYDLVKWRIKKA